MGQKVAQRDAGTDIPTSRPKLATWRVLEVAMAATAAVAHAAEVAAGLAVILRIPCADAAVAPSFISEGIAMEDTHICMPNATLLGAQVCTVAAMLAVDARGAIDSTLVPITQVAAMEATERQ